jgi:hypothetical protein
VSPQFQPQTALRSWSSKGRKAKSRNVLKDDVSDTRLFECAAHKIERNLMEIPVGQRVCKLAFIADVALRWIPKDDPGKSCIQGVISLRSGADGTSLTDPDRSQVNQKTTSESLMGKELYLEVHRNISGLPRRAGPGRPNRCPSKDLNSQPRHRL